MNSLTCLLDRPCFDHMFAFFRHQPSPDPAAIAHVTADEWLAGVLTLDPRGLRSLDALLHDLNNGHPFNPFWLAGIRELIELYGGADRLEHHMASILAEVDSVVGQQPKVVRHPQTLARGIAYTYLALAHRGQLSKKGRYGLLQPLLSRV